MKLKEINLGITLKNKGYLTLICHIIGDSPW